MSYFENVTLRTRRISEPAIETFEECSNSTIEGDTNDSVPNIVMDDENEELKRQICELNIQLQAAHEEINNLSIENTDLRKTMEVMNGKYKILEKATKKLASETVTPNRKTKLHTPLKRTIQKSLNYGSPELFTSTQVTTQVTPKNKPEQSMIQRRTITTVQEKSKLCIISSNRTNKILPIAENTFPCHQTCHFLLPNCGIKSLLCNISTKLSGYTMKDNCIIFIGEDDFLKTNNYFELITIIRESLSAIKHTNIILCLPTYKFGYYCGMYNFRIEMFNNLLYQDTQIDNYVTLFDSNLDLLCDYSMFQRKSCRINNYAVSNIFSNLKYYISTDSNLNIQKPANEPASQKDLLYCDSPLSFNSCTTDVLDQNFFRV